MTLTLRFQCMRQIYSQSNRLIFIRFEMFYCYLKLTQNRLIGMAIKWILFISMNSWNDEKNGFFRVVFIDFRFSRVTTMFCWASNNARSNVISWIKRIHCNNYNVSTDICMRCFEHFSIRLIWIIRSGFACIACDVKCFATAFASLS